MKNSELRSYNQSRTIYQIGIVVADIDEAVKKWVETYHVGPWTILTHSNEYLKDPCIQPCAANQSWKFHVALASIGDLQIELIQPVYGIPLYEDFLRVHGEGIHHFKEIMPNREMEEAVDSYRQQGVRILFGGDFFGAKFYYPDTIPLMGIQIELGNGLPADLPPTYTQKRIYPSE